ncbi:RER1 (predicted) [Pycnogonum litorale]
METSESLKPQPNIITQAFRRFGQIYQNSLDSLTPYTVIRWVITFLLTVVYLARIFVLQGWYIITYALGIYHLNLFIAFLTPKIDPSMDDIDEDGPSLPTSNNAEFRPFIRRLPEFKFWCSATKATIISLFCTFFEVFNIPVFWPILVMYFITLFCITMKRQIRHMIKYKYIPFTHGKKKYKGKEDVGKVIQNK